jgi:DNA-directed RNA polymerase subunit H (RpoH/RPB5)
MIAAPMMRAADPVAITAIAKPGQQDRAVRHGRHYGCAIAYHLRDSEAR